MNAQHEALRRQAGMYYSAKLQTFGATARGVDWNSIESQQLRFEQLLRVVLDPTGASLLDYGCGYGALIDYLPPRITLKSYLGFDVAASMVAQARALHPEGVATFTSDIGDIPTVDYAIASGVFNVKQQTSTEDWHAYVLSTLDELSSYATRGFAFNALTSYSDRHLMRGDLYYADPLALFDHCKRSYARNVALLHDYGLWEFTILVRKELD